MTSLKSFDVPPLIEPEKNDIFSLEDVTSNSEVHCHIESDFKKAGLSIKTIERLGNYNGWIKYSHKKKEIDERIPRDPNFKLNETYLYHGTSAKKESLCEEGFDVNMASQGCFGTGIYFSDTPKKCLKYAKNNIIFVARVILGESKVYKDGQKDQLLVREPEKSPPFTGWRFYNSIQGRPRNEMEYVIYRNEQALIEYIVTFSRDSIDPTPESSVSHEANITPKDDSDSINKDEKISKDIKEKTPTEADDGSKEKEDVADKSKDNNTHSDDLSDNDDNFEDAPEDYSSSSSEDEVETVSDSSSSSEDEVEKGGHGTESKTEKAWTRESSSLIPYFKLPEGELTLEQKKDEYKRVTHEEDDSSVDSMLEKTDEDVERAIFLFFAYKQVKEEEEKRQAGEFVDDPIVDDGSPIFLPMEPEYKSEAWDNLNEDDQKTKMDKMIADFLTFTLLEEDYREKATKYVSDAKYNLDTAVVNFYKSWLYMFDSENENVAEA